MKDITGTCVNKGRNSHFFVFSVSARIQPTTHSSNEAKSGDQAAARQQKITNPVAATAFVRLSANAERPIFHGLIGKLPN